VVLHRNRRNRGRATASGRAFWKRHGQASQSF
jgi:hypothetical protein